MAMGAWELWKQQHSGQGMASKEQSHPKFVSYRSKVDGAGSAAPTIKVKVARPESSTDTIPRFQHSHLITTVR